jgi:hypothetical protein
LLLKRVKLFQGIEIFYYIGYHFGMVFASAIQ